MTPSRSRRSSSVSFHHPSTPGQQLSNSGNDSYGGYDYRGRGQRIYFRSKYSNSGMSLADAVNGVRPVGGDSYKWHDLHADRNGEIFLRVAVSISSMSIEQSSSLFVLVDWVQDDHVQSAGRLVRGSCKALFSHEALCACMYPLREGKTIPHSWLFHRANLGCTRFFFLTSRTLSTSPGISSRSTPLTRSRMERGSRSSL